MAYGGGAGPVMDRSGDHDVVRPSVVRLPPGGRRNLFSDSATRRSPFPELDCVRDRLSLAMIAAVERRAIALGVGADRVLIANGVIDEDAYAIALARWLGWDYESFEHLGRDACPISDTQLIEAARVGLLPLMINGRFEFVVAPRSVRMLLDFAAKAPGVRFRLTSARRFNGWIADFAAEPLGERAADALNLRRPDLSSATRSARGWIVLVSLVAILVGALLTVPKQTIGVAETMLAAFFLSWLALRLIGCFVAPKPVATPPVAHRDLPIYTVIVALYREAASVDELVAALRKLNYPPEKLDIKFVIEPYDLETWAALHRLDLGPPFEIIVAPQAGPKTKPKALNAALPFAKGTFTVVYDAEDRPEPDQLRRVVELFLAEDADVACVQGRLTIEIPTTAGSHACSRRNTPRSSTCSCPASHAWDCRCRSAALRTTSTRRCCAESVRGTPTTSRRTPTSAYGSRVSAIAPS